MARYIFITGGVVSSLGKGLASAALGALLQARGYSVRLRKLDPYLNVDPGTMSPFEHGEVFVTDDGAETDLDLGHYERFTGVAARKSDSISSGRISSIARTGSVQPTIRAASWMMLASPMTTARAFVRTSSFISAITVTSGPTPAASPMVIPRIGRSSVLIVPPRHRV